MFQNGNSTRGVRDIHVDCPSSYRWRCADTTTRWHSRRRSTGLRHFCALSSAQRSRFGSSAPQGLKSSIGAALNKPSVVRSNVSPAPTSTPDPIPLVSEDVSVLYVNFQHIDNPILPVIPSFVLPSGFLMYHASFVIPDSRSPGLARTRPHIIHSQPGPSPLS